MPANTQTAEAPQYPATSQTVAVTALILGWLIPGAGHLLLKRWGRAALLSLSIVAMFVLGVQMQGKVYAFNTGDILDMLGFVGDIGAGALYIATRVMDWGQGNIQIAAADYGTKFIIVAGLLNIISAVDAYSIAQGKKP